MYDGSSKLVVNIVLHTLDRMLLILSSLPSSETQNNAFFLFRYRLPRELCINSRPMSFQMLFTNTH